MQQRCILKQQWPKWIIRDSNPKPIGYEPIALTIAPMILILCHSQQHIFLIETSIKIACLVDTSANHGVNFSFHFFPTLRTHMSSSCILFHRHRNNFFVSTFWTLKWIFHIIYFSFSLSSSFNCFTSSPKVSLSEYCFTIFS